MLARITAVLVAYGPLGILLLAFIDSAGIPVAAGMDALVLLVAIEAPSRAYLGALMAVVGSMAGNFVLFTVARKGGKRFLDRAAEPGRSRRFRNWFDRYGLVTVFIPALVPVIPLPLKVFVVSAGALRMRYRTFLVVMLTARVLRYFGEAWLGVKLGQESTRYLRDHAWNLAGSALALALALYLLVRFSDRYRKTASA